MGKQHTCMRVVEQGHTCVSTAAPTPATAGGTCAVLLLLLLQAALGGGLMLISANNITLTDSEVAANSATINADEVRPLGGRLVPHHSGACAVLCCAGQGCAQQSAGHKG